jgi:hypothetical protein
MTRVLANRQNVGAMAAPAGDRTNPRKVQALAEVPTGACSGGRPGDGSQATQGDRVALDRHWVAWPRARGWRVLWRHARDGRMSYGTMEHMSPAVKLRAALELHEAGVAVMRQNLRRRNPNASAAEIENLLTRISTRPGAEHGDTVGRPSLRLHA